MHTRTEPTSYKYQQDQVKSRKKHQGEFSDVMGDIFYLSQMLMMLVFHESEKMFQIYL